MVDLSHNDQDADNAPSDDEALLDPSEAAEIVPDDPDDPMDSDDEDGQANDAEQEIQLQNDSIAYFDLHSDSIFCIASHPRDPTIIATGGGDDTTFVFSADVSSPPPLPSSYESNPSTSRSSLEPVAKLQGHTDSVNAITYTLPQGDYLVTGGLEGQIRVYSTGINQQKYPLLATAQEVPEINFLIPCPHPTYPDTFALGANDGSVWIYRIDAQDRDNPLQVVQAYYLHTESCTVGAWTADGKLLATVSEDGSLYVWDPFSEAAAAGITNSSSGQAVVGLTAADQRFAVEGGLFSIAIAPSGAFVAVGGAHGMIRIVGLPRLNTLSSTSATQSLKGGGAKNKAGGKKQASGPVDAAGSGSQAGQILASIQVQSESIETLAFSPHHSLLAAGSVDGSIVLFDCAHRFAVRRHVKEAHEDFAVVKVAFGAEQDQAWFLTSCGMDGVVRRWDCRGHAGAGPTGAAGTGAGGQQQGLVKEWRGHRGEGEGGGVLGFVQIDGRKVVTAGDDGVSLVFV
ncbi:MAG: hypothetical protein Q9166_007236 [cf. Caloplaca sp. 2 TL-2023]